MSLTGKHYALIAACLASIGAMIGAFHDWHEALSPQFIGGMIGVVGAQVGAIFSDKP